MITSQQASVIVYSSIIIIFSTSHKLYQSATNSLRGFVFLFNIQCRVKSCLCSQFSFPSFVLSVMWELHVVFHYFEVLRLLSRAMEVPHFEV